MTDMNRRTAIQIAAASASMLFITNDFLAGKEERIPMSEFPNLESPLRESGGRVVPTRFRQKGRVKQKEAVKLRHHPWSTSR